MADDDDFNLDEALEASLAQMEANDNDNDNNNNGNSNNSSNNNTDTTINMDTTEAKEAGHDATSAADDAIMQEALNAVQQSINNANTAEANNDMMNDDEMKEFFNEIFKSFSNLDDDADDASLDQALKKVMTQFFDSNQLKEPVQIICNKYPSWLDENKEKLSTQDYQNYHAQCELYRQANILLSASKPDTSKIMDILLKTFSYGSLPPAVMDGMMPDELKQFADQMAQFEKDIDKTNGDRNDAPNNNATNNGNQNSNAPNNDNNNNANANANANGGDDDMNAQEAMRFFQQLMGMQNNNNNGGNAGGAENANNANNDFMPNLDDLPKLNEQEMKQFKELMNQDGCSIM
eukprot:CAMPEP_0197031634 /NCGR_PEP_ID=MMETSP1384-20130603/10587_1 /TAXON_ID=29189 /ORGANISM="Ammonia sp." /LENGTH=348 /DNA_ID=CAMNT_0042461193 /DNA_START=69 /DNA_END=1115 /DNA_ORIENTATION=-